MTSLPELKEEGKKEQVLNFNIMRHGRYDRAFNENFVQKLYSEIEKRDKDLVLAKLKDSEVCLINIQQAKEIQSLKEEIERLKLNK